MSEKIYQLNVVCEPEFSVVCGLLGEGRADQGEIKRIFDSELVKLRELIQSTALMREVSFHISGKAGKDLETTDSLAVLLTVGEAGEQYVHELFAQGEHLRALVVDAMLSAWLFAIDEKVQDEIRVFCAGQGVGVAKRLEAPDDLSVEMQGMVCQTLDADRLAGVRVTEAHMLVPEKSMCYVLELTDDCDRFAAGHDCAKCEKKDCGMRKNNMIKILVEDQGKKYDCEAGSVLIDTLREHGVRIDAPCGGSGRCGKCRVRVVSGELPVTAEDRAFLSECEIASGVRLACTARPLSDLRIRVLAKTGKQIAAVAEMSSGVQEHGVKAAVGKNVIPDDDDKAVERQNPGIRELSVSDANGYGIAVDIGTTTLAACLYGWSDGTVIETVTAVNSGRDFGADVLSRMEASNNGKRARLQELLQEDVCGMLAELLRRAGVQAADVKKLVIAANMTMVHLLMGYSCETLGRAPFVPANKRMIRADAMRILGDGCLRCPVVILPAVSAFVGGDIVSGMLTLGMDKGNDTALLLDVGTNGEMALRHNRQIYVTSTAAGPAFEGGGISCGCASVPGAICGVKLVEGQADRRESLTERRTGTYQEQDLMLRTIGDAAPVGICGSGVLELVSELLRVGLLDETGLLAEQYRESGFPLGENASGEPIIFTQGDVRALQLAKGAIRAGIEALLAAAGVRPEEVSQIYLAGGFGVRMDEQAAICIGLLPEAFRGRIRPVGNSSLSGAVFAGRCAQLESACEELLAQCRQVVLAEQPEFEENYLKYMNL
ncbi:MAG: ASKHA domain-containing protein [Lachnospiraceae bacterium]